MLPLMVCLFFVSFILHVRPPMLKDKCDLG